MAFFWGDGKMRGARHEEGIVRGSVQGIRARIRVISEVACEATVGLLSAIGEECE